MYKIKIKGLAFSACHGVNPEEKLNEQPFLININAKISGHAENDNIESTVSYAKIIKTIKAVIEGESVDLIETLAENISCEILTAYDKINEIEVEVEKPQAPVSTPFENISVSVKRKRSRAYISAGSNLGDKKAYLKYGFSRLNAEKHTKILKTATLIETEPYGNLNQPSFLNGLIEIETILDPFELLNFLHDIENSAERKRIEHWGPRTLDLDIVFFDDEIIYSDNLIIPHPDMCNRTFVLAPLAEIAPLFIHPVKNKTVKELLSEMETKNPR